MNTAESVSRLSSAVWVLAALAFASGCSSDEGDGSPTPEATDTPAAGPDIEALLEPGGYSAPLDAIPAPEEAARPGPDGSIQATSKVYFLATGSKGQGLFSVPASGGTAKELYTGDPYVAPSGLTLSSDYKTVYVADPDAGGEGIGAIVTYNIATGQAGLLGASVGTQPRSLTLRATSSGDVIYFTGFNPIDGKPAVLSIAVTNGQPMVVAKGAPLVSPDGIAVTTTGTVYVADREAAGNGLGKVFKVAGGSVTPIVESVKTGTPAGIALTSDDATLLVSAINADTGYDQVLVVNLSTLEVSIVTDVVSANTAAGGVHAQPGTNTFAWSDLGYGAGKSGGGAGMVYLIGL